MSTARFFVAATVTGSLAALWLTHPLLTAPGSTVLDDGTLDPFQFMWNLWWARESLLHLHSNPFHTDYLFYPTGVGLLFHTLSFSLGVLSIPLQALPGGVVTAHNLLVAASPLLGIVCVGFLAREAGADASSAIIGGLCATLSTVSIWFLPVLYLDCWYLIALLLWAWWRMQATRRAGRVVAALAVLLVLVFASPEFAMIALALLATDFVLRLGFADRLRLPPSWPAGSAAFWATAVAGLGLLLVAAAGEPAAPPPPRQIGLGSAYAIGFVTPPWLIAPGKKFWTLIYLGTAPMLLATIGAVEARARVWLLALAAMLLMALGPYLHLLHPLGWDMSRSPDVLDAAGVPGPYLLFLEWIPILKFFRAPYRWMVGAAIVLGVLAALGATLLRRRVRSDRGRIVLTASLLLGVALLGTLDARGLRAPVASARIPHAYHHLRTDGVRGAVLELPSGIGPNFALFSSRWMYYQTFHRQPLLEGTVARLPPGARAVVERRIDDFRTLPFVKWVVIHRDQLAHTLPESREQVATIERVLVRDGERLPTTGPVEVWRLRTFRPHGESAALP